MSPPPIQLKKKVRADFPGEVCFFLANRIGRFLFYRMGGGGEEFTKMSEIFLIGYIHNFGGFLHSKKGVKAVRCFLPFQN